MGVGSGISGLDGVVGGGNGGSVGSGMGGSTGVGTGGSTGSGVGGSIGVGVGGSVGLGVIGGMVGFDGIRVVTSWYRQLMMPSGSRWDLTAADVSKNKCVSDI